NVAVGTNPASVVIGDFNGDGRSDLAVANYGSNNVSILLGSGSGTFGAATNFTVGSTPYSVAIGDFNGDGRSDLAVANYNSNSVSILLGDGNGSFGSATNVAVGTNPASVAIGDFNGDGRSDLAVANLSSNNVSILLNSATPGALSLSIGWVTVEAAGGTATITVTRTGGSDCSVTVNYATADATAVAGSDYSATSGTLTFGPGVLSQSFTIPILNDSINEAMETFTVTITNPTGGATLLAPTVATVWIVDDDPLPALSINNVTQAEGNSGTSNFVFTVALTGSTAQTVTVNYATANGTATAGSDYTATGGTLTFTPGVTTQTVSVPVAGDTVNETNETFTVNLSAPVNATITTATGTGTIVNDDGAPTLLIDNVTQAEGNSGTSNFVFTVTLAGSTAQTVTVNYATANGTAVAGSDYTSTSGTLTFAPGTTTQTVAVPVTGDTTVESDETFTVNLSAPVNATITTATGTGTIINDDFVADLAIVKSAGSGPFYASQNAVFNIAVANGGPSTATNVTVTDVLPPGTTFVSATPTQGSCTGTTTVTCNLGSLANTANAAITLTVRLDVSGSTTNTATVTSATPDPAPANNTSSATIDAASAAAIPTLSEWMLLMVAVMLVAVAILKRRI
ncbi:MAG: IPTL-CTERM sorting domain-containing protein, partial [Acidobacteriota bacterium]